MRKYIARCFALASVLCLASMPSRAESIKGEANASVGVFSRYVWRGQVLSTSAVIQPTVGITYGGFSANLWGNLDPDVKEATGEGEDSDSLAWTETDLTLSYSHTFFEKLAVGAGYIYYGLEGIPDSQDVYLSVGYATILNPTLTLYYDFDEGDGGFATLAISQPIPVVKDKIEIVPSLTLGVNLGSKVMGYDENGDTFTGLYYGEVAVATSIPLAAGVSIDPKIGYDFALGSDAKHAIEEIGAGYDHESSSIFYGGVALTLAF